MCKTAQPTQSSDLESGSLQAKNVKKPQKDYSDIAGDLIIGFADGLTVPVSLTAALTSLNSARIDTDAGLAELFSGSISMGIGAWLVITTAMQFHNHRQAQTVEAIKENLGAVIDGIMELMQTYGISREATMPLIAELSATEEHMSNFVMDLVYKIERPDPSRAVRSGLQTGLGYFAGGIFPNFCTNNTQVALYISLSVAVVILFAFGFLKNFLTVGAIQTFIVGAIAAGASYGLVRALNVRKGVAGA